MPLFNVPSLSLNKLNQYQIIPYNFKYYNNLFENPLVNNSYINNSYINNSNFILINEKPDDFIYINKDDIIINKIEYILDGILDKNIFWKHNKSIIEELEEIYEILSSTSIQNKKKFLTKINLLENSLDNQIFEKVKDLEDLNDKLEKRDCLRVLFKKIISYIDDDYKF